MFGMSAIYAAIEEHKLRQKLWASMPKDEADKARAKWEREVDERIEHRRALEVANASRPRNFWGQ